MINKKYFITIILIYSISIFSNAYADQNDPRLKLLFSNVKDSQNELSSSIYITSIWRIWSEINDPNSQQLYDLGNQLLKKREYKKSLLVFSDLINKEPDFAEGWNKRATLHFLMGNFNESIQDINKTLALEPRHFGALDGLGQIQFKLNNFYESMQTYEKLLTIVPHSSSAKKMLKLMNAQFI